MLPNPGASLPRRRCTCGRFIPQMNTNALTEEQPYTTYLVADTIKHTSRSPRIRALSFVDIAWIVAATFRAIPISADNHGEPVNPEEVAA